MRTALVDLAIFLEGAPATPELLACMHANHFIDHVECGPSFLEFRARPLRVVFIGLTSGWSFLLFMGSKPFSCMPFRN
jgi:hypothetical protein